MRFFWSLIGIIIGILILRYTYVLANAFGKIDWAEKYFGGGLGGTYFFYKLLGILLVILSALYMFGILDNLFSPLGSVFGGLKNQ